MPFPSTNPLREHWPSSRNPQTYWNTISAALRRRGWCNGRVCWVCLRAAIRGTQQVIVLRSLIRRATIRATTSLAPRSMSLMTGNLPSDAHVGGEEESTHLAPPVASLKYEQMSCEKQSWLYTFPRPTPEHPLPHLPLHEYLCGVST